MSETVAKRKLVRARPKRPEDLPEWVICCDRQVEFQQAIGELIIDLEDRCVAGSGVCMFCGAHSPRDTNAARIISGDYTGRVMALCVVDLDEGGASDGQ